MGHLTPQSKPAISQHTLEKWQRVVDLISELANVPATLIMNTVGARHAVFVKSDGDQNPYVEGQSFQLNEKLYCYGVLQGDCELSVEDATTEPRWNDNQDLEHGMSFYVGLPLKWPDDEVFGTICILDQRRNKRALLFRKGLREFCRIIQDDLAMLVEIDERKRAQANLNEELASRETIIRTSTQNLEDANTALRVLLNNVETAKTEIEHNISQRIKGLVLPHVRKMRQVHSDDERLAARLEIVEANLKDITSMHSDRMTDAIEALTPTEAEIVQMIVQGRSTKEIAITLSRDASTVNFHRNNIRQKLGLKNQGTNLRRYLSSLQ